MSNHRKNDPYVYPDSSVLINKFDIRNDQALQEVEGVLFALKNAEPLPTGNFDYDHLKAIHHHYFNEIYAWAGQERTVDIAKQNSYFAHIQYIEKELTKTFSKLKNDHYLQNLKSDDFCLKLAYYFNEINAAHPFREGNGRTLRAFCDVLAEQAGYQLDWSRVSIDEYIQANIHGFNGDYDAMKNIFLNIASSIAIDKEMHITDNLFTKTVQSSIVTYLEKQQNLLHAVQQRNQHAINNSALSTSLSTKIHPLDQELHTLAVNLMRNQEIKDFIKDNANIYSSLAKQGGFDSIHTRIKNNIASKEDWLAVLRHAQNKVLTLSNTINRGNNRGGQSR